MQLLSPLLIHMSIQARALKIHQKTPKIKHKLIGRETLYVGRVILPIRPLTSDFILHHKPPNIKFINLYLVGALLRTVFGDASLSVISKVQLTGLHPRLVRGIFLVNCYVDGRGAQSL